MWTSILKTNFWYFLTYNYFTDQHYELLGYAVSCHSFLLHCIDIFHTLFSYDACHDASLALAHS